MANIVTASQLRALLGVSQSLYSDAQLDAIITTAQGVVLPMLAAPVYAIDVVEVTNNVATFWTVTENTFVPGDTVVVENLPAPYADTYEVTGTRNHPYYFTVDLIADDEKRPFVPNGTATLDGFAPEVIYDGQTNVEQAILAVSTEVFQSQTAVGGQIDATDFTVQPFRLSRGLFNRVVGILGNDLNVNSIIA